MLQPESADLRQSPPASAPEVRRIILDHAESLLVEAGYEAFSIRKLVARCGYTAPALYQHFGDKACLIDELLEERMSKLVKLLGAVPQTMDPVARLRALCLAFTRFGLESPTHYRLLFMHREVERESPPSGEECRRILSEPLNRLQELGRVAPGQLEPLRLVYWALIHGIISLQVARPDYDWDENVLDVALDGLIAGTILERDGGESPQ